MRGQGAIGAGLDPDADPELDPELDLELDPDPQLQDDIDLLQLLHLFLQAHEFLDLLHLLHTGES